MFLDMIKSKSAYASGNPIKSLFRNVITKFKLWTTFCINRYKYMPTTSSMMNMMIMVSIVYMLGVAVI
jgi:hypothetical protein